MHAGADKRTARLVERLHHIVVFELVNDKINKSNKNNSSNNNSNSKNNPSTPVMRTMRLRDLYNYIQSAVCDGDDQMEGGGTGATSPIASSTTNSIISGVGTFGEDDDKEWRRKSRRRSSR